MGENPLIEKVLALPRDQMLTPKDLVDLGVVRSETRLYHMRERNEGPPYTKIPQRSYLYAPNDVAAWLRSCQRPSQFNTNQEDE
jgi:hypothetical protein